MSSNLHHADPGLTPRQSAAPDEGAGAALEADFLEPSFLRRLGWVDWLFAVLLAVGAGFALMQYGHWMNGYDKAVLIAAVPPLMVKTEANPGGLPKEVFDGFQAQVANNRAQFYRDIPEGPFYGYNRPGAKAQEGVIANWWRQGMMGGANAHYEGIKAFSETDQTEDLKAITVPTAPPSSGLSTWKGGTYDFTSFIRPRMYGSTDMTVLATRISPSCNGGRSTSTSRKLSGVGAPLGREARWISRVLLGMVMRSA